MSDLISRQDAIDAIEKLMEIHFDRKVVLGKAKDSIESLPSADRPKSECTGCKYIGTYDTEFPCANCTRKTKDYYCGADMRGGEDSD